MRRRENNIKMNLKEISCEGMSWIQVTLDRVVWCALLYTVIDLDHLGDYRLFKNQVPFCSKA
jgi:hypothetical protein